MFNNLLIILVFLFLFIISTHNKINITKLSIQYIFLNIRLFFQSHILNEYSVKCFIELIFLNCSIKGQRKKKEKKSLEIFSKFILHWRSSGFAFIGSEAGRDAPSWYLGSCTVKHARTACNDHWWALYHASHWSLSPNNSIKADKMLIPPRKKFPPPVWLLSANKGLSSRSHDNRRGSSLRIIICW